MFLLVTCAPQIFTAASKKHKLLLFLSFIWQYQGCNETFSRRGYLKLHIQRQHTGEKPYKCQVHGCNKSFHVSSNCSRHQKTHFKEVSNLRYQQFRPVIKWFIYLSLFLYCFQRKPFPCTFPGCDKTYSNNNTLRRHSILKHPLITKVERITGAITEYHRPSYINNANKDKHDTSTISHIHVTVNQVLLVLEHMWYMSNPSVGADVIGFWHIVRSSIASII